MDNDEGTAPNPHRPYDGPERRQADVPDRRKMPRGGRRAADAPARVAGFVYKLLTEPPQ